MTGGAVASPKGAEGKALSASACIPLQVVDKTAEGLIEIEWADEALTQLTYQDLRLNCKCAECVAGRRKVDLKSGAEDEPECIVDGYLRIERIELIGSHALNFRFSDGHYRGIYPWSYLRSLSESVSDVLK